MITTISIENLGPIPQMTADGLGKVKHSYLKHFLQA